MSREPTATRHASATWVPGHMGTTTWPLRPCHAADRRRWCGAMQRRHHDTAVGASRSPPWYHHPSTLCPGQACHTRRDCNARTSATTAPLMQHLCPPQPVACAGARAEAGLAARGAHCPERLPCPNPTHACGGSGSCSGRGHTALRAATVAGAQAMRAAAVPDRCFCLVAARRAAQLHREPWWRHRGVSCCCYERRSSSSAASSASLPACCAGAACFGATRCFGAETAPETASIPTSSRTCTGTHCRRRRRGGPR